MRFFNELLELKEVYRQTADDRTDSSAEHTWGCLLLADHYIDLVEKELNRERVFRLILYHDLVEVEAGDIPVTDEEAREEKEEIEREAFETITERMPDGWSERYAEFYEEYEANETMEAKFAHAMDKLEPLAQWLDVPDELREQGYTKEFMREKKMPYLEPFPVLVDEFERVLADL